MRWRYALHAADAAGRLALARRAPERALARADEEIAGARRHRVPKVEARGLVLRGDALVVLERLDDAAVTLAEAVRVADAIRHPRAAWQALAGLAELARRRGDAAGAARHAARHRSLLAAAVSSVGDPALASALRAAQSAPASR